MSSTRAHKGWETRRQAEERVIVNIDPEHQALWKRVRGGFGKGDPHARAEAFEEYAAEHPGEVIEAMQDEADARLQQLISERVREAPPPRKKTMPKKTRKKRVKSRKPGWVLAKRARHLLAILKKRRIPLDEKKPPF